MYRYASRRGRFLYPYVDESVCVHCGKRVAVCPNLSKKEKSLEKETRAYAIVNSQEEIRRNSSSGGVFYALAEDVLKHGGVVFGASFNAHKQLRHTFVERIEDLPKLMGSKYVQSEIGNTFLQAKDFLSNGRKVFFVGTPCQIAGLKSFLGKSYEHLLCADIVCHGVPSPMLWAKYKQVQERKYGGEIEKISFRDKSTGWRAYSMRLKFSNGKVYQKPHEEDVYMRLFLSDACLRPSCHSCLNKGIHRFSDLTLADCWGAERILGETDEDKGISLVLVHTDKGEVAIKDVSQSLQTREVNVQLAIKENPSAVKATKPHEKRGDFFAEIDKISFKKAVKKYAPLQRSCKEKVAIFLRKIGIWGILKKIKHK